MGTNRTPDDEALLEAVRLLTGIAVRAADEAGELSPVQLRALTVLHAAEGANLASLAEAMGVAVSTSSRLVDRLVAAGWVDRRPSHANRREITLSLTGEGTAALGRYDDLRLTGVRARLDRLPAGCRAEVIAALLALTGDR